MMIKESCYLTEWQDLGEFSFYVLPAKSRDKILWKLEKFRLGPIFGLFLPILGQIRIFWKIHYCNFFLLLGFCHCAKLQSTLKNRFDKKTWRRDGGTDWQVLIHMAFFLEVLHFGNESRLVTLVKKVCDMTYMTTWRLRHDWDISLKEKIALATLLEQLVKVKKTRHCLSIMVDDNALLYENELILSAKISQEHSRKSGLKKMRF